MSKYPASLGYMGGGSKWRSLQEIDQNQPPPTFSDRHYIAMVFLCRSEMADKFTFFWTNGAASPGKTSWSQKEFLPPLEISISALWKKSNKISLSTDLLFVSARTKIQFLSHKISEKQISFLSEEKTQEREDLIRIRIKLERVFPTVVTLSPNIV